MNTIKVAFKIFLISLFGLVLLFSIFIFYAIQPGIPPSKLPSEGIVKFADTYAPPKTPSAKELKVVTYNMGYASGETNNRGRVLTREQAEKNLEDMIHSLKELNPDILFLQEVDFFSSRSFDKDQLEILAKGLGLPFAAYALTWNKSYVAWPYWPLSRHFGRVVSGQAVLSRIPISQQEILRFEKPRENPFWYNWFYLNRLVQRLKLEFGSRSIEIYNVHLEAFSLSANQQQLMLLAKWIKSGSPTPKIVAGDFNLDALLENEQKLLEDFGSQANLKMAQPGSRQSTYSSWEPIERIDFIFYSPEWEETQYGVLAGLLASDHLPIWVRLGR